MKKVISILVLVGVLGFSFRHILRPAAKGAGKVLHFSYKVAV